MNINRQLLPALTAGVLVLFSSGCAKLQSRDNLNKGVAAFKNAKYAESAALFKQAAELDPSNTNARLYLATSYMVQWIPGAESPENAALAQNARAEFLKVYEGDNKDQNAMAYLASLAFNEGKATQAVGDGAAKRKAKFEEAKDWYTKLLAVNPQDKVAYYSLGVIAWENWYPVLMNARAKLSMKPEDLGPIKDKKVREELKAEYGQVVEDGISNLRKAIEVDKEYEDAMAYLNLLIRERADLAESTEGYKKDVEEADQWVQRTLDTKKIKAERSAKAATGITTGN
jgi:tetratricopeptide (TPR) repeat protein